MTWQEAASLHEDRAGLMLDVVESQIVRLRAWNRTDRAVQVNVHHIQNAQKVWQVVLPAGTPVTEAPVPPGLGANAWDESGFQLSDV